MGWPGFLTVAGFAVMVAVIDHLTFAWVLAIGLVLCVVMVAVMIRTAVKR
jgi:hypothetical protein